MLICFLIVIVCYKSAPTYIQQVMELFMKELDDFVKIINSCFTEEVSKWKESDLQRVIDWGDYFKKVKSSYESLEIPPSLLTCG